MLMSATFATIAGLETMNKLRDSTILFSPRTHGVVNEQSTSRVAALLPMLRDVSVAAGTHTTAGNYVRDAANTSSWIGTRRARPKKECRFCYWSSVHGHGAYEYSYFMFLLLSLSLSPPPHL
jgi:hypothetical protein